jgi:hypothetical protein
MLSARRVLIALAIAFSGYLALRGLIWTTEVYLPALIIIAFALFLGVTLVCLLTDGVGDPPSPDRLPGWACVLALFTSFVVPNLLSLSVPIAARAEPFITWYIGGIGGLSVIVMARGRLATAWGCTAILTATSMFWLGPLRALAMGLVGSLMWAVAAHLVTYSLSKARRDTEQLAELQTSASVLRARQEGQQRERRVRVRRALEVAGPILTRTIQMRGLLTEAERAEARMAEGTLRDELRAPLLHDDGVREVLDAARRRGTTIIVLDEGGLERHDERELSAIRGELAATIAGCASERIYIRTSPDDQIAVTVVGRSGAGAAEDLDLRHEIARPGAARVAAAAVDIPSGS